MNLGLGMGVERPKAGAQSTGNPEALRADDTTVTADNMNHTVDEAP
jgi:hypothetical protein